MDKVIITFVEYFDLNKLELLWLHYEIGELAFDFKTSKFRTGPEISMTVKAIAWFVTAMARLNLNYFIESFMQNKNKLNFAIFSFLVN